MNFENHNNRRQKYILAFEETNSRWETICKLLTHWVWILMKFLLRKFKSEVYYKIPNFEINLFAYNHIYIYFFFLIGWYFFNFWKANTLLEYNDDMVEYKCFFFYNYNLIKTLLTLKIPNGDSSYQIFLVQSPV